MNLEQSGPWIGIAGLVCLLWLYGASILIIPWWAVAGLVVLWVVLFVYGCRWFGRWPYAVLLLPLWGVALWLAAVVVTRG
ncbi:MAG: hypothetical protein GEU93_06280 [Propionibacteriales bacterium]|nr:hypothetical protein [Propionibacteriales bacterium]